MLFFFFLIRDMSQSRVTVRVRTTVTAEKLCTAVADSQTLSAQQVVKDKDGQEVVLSFGAGPPGSENNDNMPQYIEDEDDEEEELDNQQIALHSKAIGVVRCLFSLAFVSVSWYLYRAGCATNVYHACCTNTLPFFRRLPPPFSPLTSPLFFWYGLFVLACFTPLAVGMIGVVMVQCGIIIRVGFSLLVSGEQMKWIRKRRKRRKNITKTHTIESTILCRRHGHIHSHPKLYTHVHINTLYSSSFSIFFFGIN